MSNLFSKSYLELREYMDTVPVIETHEHYTGITGPLTNVFEITGYYYRSDLLAASFGEENGITSALDDNLTDFDNRFDVFEKAFKKSDKTAYAAALKTGLKECWGIEALDRSSMRKLQEKFLNRSQEFYDALMKKYSIKAKIVDMSSFELEKFVRLIDGKDREYTGYCRFTFPLYDFHNINRLADIKRLEGCLGQSIYCLEDYENAFESFLKKAVEFGIVCIKDPSAYRRRINYPATGRAEAEQAFNKIMQNPRRVCSTDEIEGLDNWLFHRFMRAAARYGLPVQIHTGHLAGIRNDIRNANASEFIPVLEQHQDVRFDLFHGNWPYMGEYLFIGKNYPNAWLDLCWVQSVDPLYSIELMKRALVTVPHSKLMAFGGDTEAIELAVGYLVMARDNAAAALSEMTDKGWIGIQEAKQVAADWFFNNPNAFFKLGFENFLA